MIDRRQLLVGGLLLPALPMAARAALPVPPGNRLGFDIVREGSTLGSHVLTFTPTATGVAIHVAVDLAYKLMGITLYRYTHRATEIWSGDQVVAMQANTDDNGTAFEVSAKRDTSGLVVTGSKAPRYVAPAAALPATHWNRHELDGPWINTQDGRLMHPKVSPGGIETIPAAGGASVPGRHFNLSGDVRLDMWYDDRLGWTGLSFVKGGAPIRYERQG